MWIGTTGTAVLLSCVLTASPVRGGRPDRAPGSREVGSMGKGRSLYVKHCAACHGPTGRGDGASGRDLDPPPSSLCDGDVAGQTDSQLFRKITRGRRPMPSFRKLLSDQERWEIVSYVRTLSQQANAGGQQ